MRFAHVFATIALTVTTVLATVATARELPDLVIADVRLKATGACAAGRAVIAGTVQVVNAGRGRGQIFTTREMLAARAPRVPGLAGVARFVNSMRPGDVQTVRLALHAARPVKVKGAVTVVITVDPGNVFPEADEANNTLTVQVMVDCE